MLPRVYCFIKGFKQYGECTYSSFWITHEEPTLQGLQISLGGCKRDLFCTRALGWLCASSTRPTGGDKGQVAISRSHLAQNPTGVHCCSASLCCLIVHVEVCESPVCYPSPKASFRTWRNCSKKYHLWYLLEENVASCLPCQDPRKLMYKMETVVWLNQPLIQPPSKAASRYFKTNLNKLCIWLKYDSPGFMGFFFLVALEKK